MKCPFNFQTESGHSIFTREDVKGSVIALKTRLQIRMRIYLSMVRGSIYAVVKRYFQYECFVGTIITVRYPRLFGPSDVSQIHVVNTWPCHTYNLIGA